MWFDLSVYAGKTAFVLIYLFLGFRLLGKRQVAQGGVLVRGRIEANPSIRLWDLFALQP